MPNGIFRLLIEWSLVRIQPGEPQLLKYCEIAPPISGTRRGARSGAVYISANAAEILNQM
jgi:hypothetical protein